MKIIAKDIETEYHNRLWYYNVYNNLINKALNRGLDKTKLEGYYEKHHILPKCIDGKDENSNYVLLTAKEHILAHMLLSRIYPDNLNLVRSTSAILMKNRGRVDQLFSISLRTITSIRENYANYKDEFSKEQLGKEISESHRKNLSKSHIGNKLSEDTKNKLKKSRYHCTVEGPNGDIYSSIVECSKKTGIAQTTLKDWIKNRPEKGYKIIETNRQSKSIKVIGSDGTIYSSIKDCAKKLNRNDKTIKSWIERHPELGYKYYNN